MNRNLKGKSKLPKGFRLLNPFEDNPETRQVMQAFYQKYYNDCQPRKLILAINPGRFGAGLTGVPFTDTKHLKSHCGIEMHSAQSHETSGMFVYDLIDAFGGTQKFYQQFFIHNAFPLAIVRKNKKGKWVNANYYDSKTLFTAVKTEMINHLKQLKQLTGESTVVVALGKKNERFLQEINKEQAVFHEIIPVEHPRYIQQYKTKDKDFYIEKYLRILADKV